MRLLTLFLAVLSFAAPVCVAQISIADESQMAGNRTIMLPGKMAMRFDRTLRQIDNRGPFWRPGVAYNQPFFFSANVYPTGGAEYIVSAGTGGIHNLLFGFTGCDPVTNRTTLTGNVGSYPQNAVPVKDWQNRIPELMAQPKYALGKKESRGVVGDQYREYSALDSSSVTQTSFVSTDEIRCNEWVNVSVGYDGVSSIGLWINGLPAARVSFDGRRMSIYPFETTLYIGGSDHSNFNGWIRNAVLFEGAFPLDSVTRSFYPERNFQSVVIGYDGQRIKSSLLVNYSEGTLLDYSSGFEGVMHPGRLMQNPMQISDGGFFGVRKAEEDISERLILFDLVPPAGLPQPNEVPVGATIFDSFSRANTNPASSAFVGLGVTEIGNRQWQNSSHTRVINGHVGATNDHETFYFDTNSPSGRVCARRGAAPDPNASYYELNVKVRDNLTKIGLVSDPFGSVRFLRYDVTPFAPTVLGGVVRPSNWSKVCVDYTSTTVKAFFDDGPFVLEASVPSNFADFGGVGLTMSSAASIGTRWDWISVVTN